MISGIADRFPSSFRMLFFFSDVNTSLCCSLLRSVVGQIPHVVMLAGETAKLHLILYLLYLIIA